MAPDDPNPEMEQVALHYGGLGIPVFRLRPREKKPLAKGWQEEATTDPAEIRKLWSETPDANVGIPTGRASGLVVPDVDPRNGGKESLEELCERFGLGWLDTLTVRTGGGGWHLWYKYPQGREVPNDKLAKGIDLQSDGLLVVAPGSIHPSGNRYTVEDPEKPIQPLPEWILDLVEGREHSANGDERSTRIVNLFRDGVEEGSRNEAISYLARHFARRGLAPDIATAILEDFNHHRVRPPIDESDPEEKSIAATVRSNYRTVRDKEESGSLTVSDLEIWDASDLMRADIPEPGWVAKGFMPENTVGVHAGLFDTGKSWFALQIMMDAALGRPVFDHYPVPRPMRSLALLGEGTSATTRSRLHTLARAQGVAPEELQDRIRTVRAPEGLTLGNPEHDELIRKLVRDHESDILWIDPFVEFFGGSESDDEDLNEAFSSLRWLRDDLNIAVQVMHHARQPSDQDAGRPPGVRFRGRTNIADKADIAYLLEGPGRRDIRLTRAKSRNAIVEEKFILRWVEGETDGGDTLRLVHEEDSDIISGGEDLEPAVERAIHELKRVMAKEGPDSYGYYTNNSPRDGGPDGGTRVLKKGIAKLEEWREFWVDEDGLHQKNQKTVMPYHKAMELGYVAASEQMEISEEGDAGPGGPS